MATPLRPTSDPYALPAPHPWEHVPRLDAATCRATFDATPPFTIGVEEELMLVDPETLELAPAVADALSVVAGDKRFAPELRASQLEIITPICTTVTEACAALSDARATLVAALDGSYRILGAGTHPFSTNWGGITDADRYKAIADEYEWAARRSLACGLHVHVAVGGADRSLAVYNALRSYLPELGALASNSPFLEGRDTGMCSIRGKLNEAFPRAGVPPAFESWEEMVAFVDWAREGGLFPDASHFWWELRPHPIHGTLELRAADAQTRIEDATAVAAVIHALVVWLAHRFDAGDPLPLHDSYRIRENQWRSARYGVRGWLVDLDTGDPQPTRMRLEHLITTLEPIGAELDCSDQLAEARTLLLGSGADRQRYVAARTGLRGLAEWLVEETEEPTRFAADLAGGRVTA